MRDFLKESPSKRCACLLKLTFSLTLRFKKQIKTKISVRKLKMAQQDSFWKIYSTKALNIKNPTKNLPPVRPPLFYRCKMTRIKQFIDACLNVSDEKLCFCIKFYYFRRRPDVVNRTLSNVN